MEAEKHRSTTRRGGADRWRHRVVGVFAQAEARSRSTAHRARRWFDITMYVDNVEVMTSVRRHHRGDLAIDVAEGEADADDHQGELAGLGERDGGRGCRRADP